MTQKPTYEELEQKIKELERKIIECKQNNLELRASEKSIDLSLKTAAILYSQPIMKEGICMSRLPTNVF